MSSRYCRNSQQQQQVLLNNQLEYPISISQESISCMKNNQNSTIDDLGTFFAEDSTSVIDYSIVSEYNSRFNFSDFEDDSELIFFQ